MRGVCDELEPSPSQTLNDSAEQTLRLIAGVPAPEGLEDRVHKAFRAAPRNGRVLAWPAGMRSRISFRSNSIRTAAAAAIIFVVVGGGWGVYSRVQLVQTGKVVVMPAPMTNTGGFSGAGAIRTPQTLPGPKISEQATHRAQIARWEPRQGPREQGNKKADPRTSPWSLRRTREPRPGRADLQASNMDRDNTL